MYFTYCPLSYNLGPLPNVHPYGQMPLSDHPVVGTYGSKCSLPHLSGSQQETDGRLQRVLEENLMKKVFMEV